MNSTDLGNTDCKIGNPMLSSIRRSLCDALMYLDNCTNSPDYMPFQGDKTEMATKINRTVMIVGKKRWIHANTEQEHADKLAGLILGGVAGDEKHNFKEYALNWYEVYSKPNVETATSTTYKRQLTLYLIPALGDKAIEDITTDDIQRLFNNMTGAKATKDRTKMILNMVLDMAVEDGIILKNSLKSKRIRITGKASETTKEYSVEQMRFLVSNIGKVKQDADRAYLALQALHPLRLEEVLGLKWEDIDIEAMVIHIRRAVTHPTRNRPEIKAPKTAASARDIGLSHIAVLSHPRRRQHVCFWR